jgi:hypothetical protein
MEKTECSEMAYKIQMPGNYPEESIQHSEHGKSLKSRRSLRSVDTREELFSHILDAATHIKKGEDQLR